VLERTKGEWLKKRACSMIEVRRIGRSCALLIPLFFISSVFAQTSGDRIDAIATSLRNREFDKALTLVRPALREAPGNAQLWTMQGVAYSGQGQKKEALASFHSALKIAPDYIPALQGAAQIEFDGGHAAAVPVLQHLLRLHPTDSTSHGMLAILLYQQGNCKAAAPHFEKAGHLFDEKADALHAYATCLVKLQQLEKARSVFERTLAMNPNDHHERQLLASLQVMTHQPRDAIATLGPLLELQPDAETLELASAAYEDSGDTDRAVSSLQQAILLDPMNVHLYLDFAAVSAAHQSFQVGINVVNDGIGLQPKSAQLYFARGVLHIQLSQYDEAQADFEKAYEFDPSQSLSVAAQGLAAAEANDLDRALTTVQTKLERKPNDPILMYLEADVLAQKGSEPATPDFQRAMRSARKAVALRPGLGPAHAVLAKLYLQGGQYNEAVEQCRKAIDIDPKDRTSLYRLVQALRKTGNKAEIPSLLTRLAALRQEATKEDREHSRFKLVEGDAEPTPQIESQP
jgi:tetratricopeptide (TPR) repeat protein